MYANKIGDICNQFEIFIPKLCMYIFHNDLSTSVSTIISLNIACTLKGFNCEWIPRVLLSLSLFFFFCVECEYFVNSVWHIQHHNVFLVNPRSLL